LATTIITFYLCNSFADESIICSHVHGTKHFIIDKKFNW